VEYVDCLDDFPDTARRIFNSVLREMLENGEYRYDCFLDKFAVVRSNGSRP